jgi:hypothetical protein
VNYPTLAKHFDTVAALIDAASTPNTSRDEWRYGTEWKDEQETRAGLLAGLAPASAFKAYEKVRPTFDALAISANANGSTRRRRRVWGDEGDEVCISRMLSDSPAPWSRTVIGRTAPIVRLAINIALSCNNTPDDFAGSVATAVAAADALTVRGLSVEIVGTHATARSRHTNQEGRGTVYTWPVKGASEPIDTARLLSLAAPGLCRAYCHSLLEKDTKDPVRGICTLPADAAAYIGTPHIIGQQWSTAGGYWREVSAADQLAQIIEASARQEVNL